MPPVNDDFANATLLSAAGGTLQDDNTGATSDGANDPLASYYGRGPETVWYKVAPTGSDRGFSIETLPPTSGPAIVDSYLWLGFGTTLAGLVYEADDDDGGPSAYSIISGVTIPAGATTYIELSGYSGDVGGYTLNWSFSVPIPPPTNNDVIDAIELPSTSGTITGSNIGADSEPLEESEWKGDPVPTVWWYYHNSSGTSKVVTLGNLVQIGGGAWDDGPEMDIWMTPQNVPGTWEQQFYFDFDAGNYIIDYMYTYSDPQDFLVPDGMTLYIEIGNQDWDDTDQGAFSFDYQISAVPNFPIISLRHGS